MPPFADLLEIRSRANLSLLEKTIDLGITPVSLIVLAEHKQREAEKRQGSWMGRLFLRHTKMFAAMLTTFSIVCVVITCLLLVATLLDAYLALSARTMWLMFGMMGFTFIAVGLETLNTFGFFTYPAIWIERPLTDVGMSFAHIPTIIADMARNIIRLSPGSFAVIGELMQGQDALVPYLLVKTRNGEQIVIGIWNSVNVIVHTASKEKLHAIRFPG